MAKTSKAERDESIKQLKKWLKPGRSEVYCILRHVSSSGMARHIDFITIRDGEPVHLTGYIAEVCGYRLAKQRGLVVGGCGMDMGFAVVYDLGRTLWPKGFKLPKGKRGRNGDESGHETDGGYALTSRWL